MRFPESTVLRRLPARGGLDERKAALIGAAICLWVLLATGVIALLVRAAHRGDIVALKGFSSLDAPPLAGIATLVATSFNTGPYALLVLTLVGVAADQRGLRSALVILGILICAPATSEILKPLLASGSGIHNGSLNIRAGSWPSGHASASMAFVLSAVLVSPAPMRGEIAAIGAVVATLVAYSVLLLGAHFPSDVLGGHLVAACWTLLGIAALGVREHRSPDARRRNRWVDRSMAVRARLRRARSSRGAAILGLVLALGAVGSLGEVTRFLGSHAIFVAGAGVILVLGAGLPSLVATVTPRAG